MSLSGNNLLISETNPSRFDRDNRSYIYHYDGSQWNTSNTLSSNTKDTEEIGDFGWAFKLDGSIALISAYDERSNQGVVYVFK